MKYLHVYVSTFWKIVKLLGEFHLIYSIYGNIVLLPCTSNDYIERESRNALRVNIFVTTSEIVTNVVTDYWILLPTSYVIPLYRSSIT